MLTETIIVANLKCDGCAATIKTRLSELEGVKVVRVYNAENKIEIDYEGITPRDVFTRRLEALGYPEAIAESNTNTQLKGYTSCSVVSLSHS